MTGRQLRACVTPAKENGEETETDCEVSAPENISKIGDSGKIVFTQPYKGIEFPHPSIFRLSKPTAAVSAEYQSLAGRFGSLAQNAFVQSVNEALWSSLRSPDRHPYAEGVSLLETEFVLDGLAQVVRLLGRAGIADRRLVQVEKFQPLVERGLGTASGATTVMDLGSISTTDVARDFSVSE